MIRQRSDYARPRFADITERKKAEEALRLSEERFRLVLRNSPVNVSSQDLNLRYSWIYNPQLGYSPSEVVGKTDNDLLNSETAKTVIALKKKAIATDAQVRQEVSSKNQGNTIWYDFTIEPQRDEKGKIVGVNNVVVDITERKKAEAALKQSEERFHNVFEQTALGIAIGMEGRVIESNSALEKMLGYSKKELNGKLFSEFTHPNDVNIEWDLIQELIAGKRDHYEIEKRYVRHNGETIWVHLIGKIILGPNKESSIGIATVENITERKKAEEDSKAKRANIP